ncbi:MAG: hypothetical protein ACTHLZ_14895 [Tepidisphaeraceae bacterium]
MAPLAEALESRQYAAATPTSNGLSIHQVTTNFGGANEAALCIVPLRGGRVLAAGTSTIHGVVRDVFALYDANGKLVSSFGSAGKVMFSAATSAWLGTPFKLKALPDGSALVLSQNGASHLQANGSLDYWFAQKGQAFGYFPDAIVYADGHADLIGVNPTDYWHGDDLAWVRVPLTKTGQWTNQNIQGPAGRPQVIAPDRIASFLDYQAAVQLYDTNAHPVKGFGTNGKVLLQPALNRWLDTMRPWTSADGRPTTTRPSVHLVNLSPTTSGGYVLDVLLLGGAGRLTTHRSAAGTLQTSIHVQLDARGNVVAINAAPVARKVAYFDPSPDSSVGVLFAGKQAVYVSAIGTVLDATAAADGTVYLAGYGHGFAIAALTLR